MVLEARHKAEKIWYPVIWEKTKGNPDVVDYNINEEITTDASAVSNANNNTTTGMATVIPWVNAPMLLEKTSIYQNSVWLAWGVSAKNTKSLSYPNSAEWWSRVRTIVNQYGNIWFKVVNEPSWWEWLEILNSWRYKIETIYPVASSTFALDISLRIAKWGGGQDIHILDYEWPYNNTQNSDTIEYFLNAWDRLYVYWEMDYIWSSTSFSGDFTLDLTITKL